MARIIPERAPKRLSKGAALVYRELKRLPCPDLTCRVSYPLEKGSRPDFLLLYKNQFSILASVSNLTEHELKDLLQGDIFNKEAFAKSLDLPERHSLDGTVEALLASMDGGGGIEVSVQKWILFPKISSSMLEQLRQVVTWSGVTLLAKEECRGDRLLEIVKESSRAPIDNWVINQLQNIFNPENTLPQSWVPKSLAKQRADEVQATQTHLFLNVDQEAAMKRELELSDEAETAAESGNLRLLTGVAGSGKTLVLLYRARLMHQLQPDARILVIMHNRPLRVDLSDRAQQIAPDACIEWRTFYEWCRQLITFSIIPEYQREKLLERLLQQSKFKLSLTTAFLLEEFDWICDQATDPMSQEKYLVLERKGRQRSLQMSQRKAVYLLFEQYRKALLEQNQIDWSGVPVRLLRKLQKGELSPPAYDAIFIDEAQFFAPVWFACLKQVLHPQRGQLFIVADPTQGFLRDGQSWNRFLGLEVRGRTQRLEHPYRNTREIMEFAKRFYLSRISMEDSEINLPEDEQFSMMRSGNKPLMFDVSSAQELHTRILNEVSAAIEKGTRPEQILIIHPDQKEVDCLVRRLSHALDHEVVDAKNAKDSRQLRVCSLNACTGLEAPIVIVVGLRLLFEAEDALHMDTMQREELVRNNTKKVFVAMTRATETLLMEGLGVLSSI